MNMSEPLAPTTKFPQATDEAARRILIVDDNASIHRDFQLVLADEVQDAELDADEARVYGVEAVTGPKGPAYELAHAMSGLEGIEQVRTSLSECRPFQMAFVDIRMPGIDGVDTIARIWEIDDRIQVVICTAYADYSQEDLLQRLGRTDKLLVLRKPFDSIEVTQLACTLTEKWFLGRQAALKLEEMELLVARRTQKLLDLQRQQDSPATGEQRQSSRPAASVAHAASGTDVTEAEAEDEEFLANRQRVILLIGSDDSLGKKLGPGLGAAYRIIEARGAEQGAMRAEEILPDLIVVDLPAERSGGLELCRSLRAASLTSHIGLVLLAEPTQVDQVKALIAGVDEWLVKPVNVPALRNRIESLIEARQRKQPGRGNSLEARDLVTDQTDARFVQRVIAVVEQNLSDFEFDVDTLARKVAVSRRQLFRKLNAVISTTPKALIRSVRLQRAAQLLAKSEMTVTEITFAVGFSDVKHFRNLFRDEFGLLPSEYLKGVGLSAKAIARDAANDDREG